MQVKEKLSVLRKKMKDSGVFAVYIPTSDPHMSEYIAPAYQTRAWISGFSGSAGQALVLPDEAKLWTDGRYFIQAEKELRGSGFDLMKQGTPGYPSLQEYLKEHMPEAAVLAVNGEILSRREAEQLQKLAEDGHFKINFDLALTEAIWEDRPALPQADIFLLEEQYSGKTTEAKLEDLRAYLAENRYDAALYGRLDDIAWLYNYRGRDIAHTPVALAYAYVSREEAVLFIDQNKVSDKQKKALKKEGVRLEAYEKVGQFLKGLSGKRIVLDKAGINNRLYEAIPSDCEIVQGKNYTEKAKAVKNETELKNLKEAYRKDGLAVTRMIYWLKTADDLRALDELEVSRKLLSYREELSHFLEESFTTIAAYGENAAMMHYAPTEKNKSNLQPESFLLVDSGGQYLEGTTDTTRTIALGPLSEQEIKAYTLSLKCHIALASAVFLKGSTGYYLDALARQPLWKHYYDYKCGTGHGVGYLLSVHEGPHSVSPRPNNVALEPGMVVTDEPGVYLEGQFGVRLENVYAVKEDCYAEPDQFYCFENLTQVPFEREAIDTGLLTAEEIAWTDAYHRQVYEALSPELGEAERAWLKEVCRPLEA